MAYEYISTTPGVFSFTVPGEERTVKLFTGDKIIVDKLLTGTYLKMFTFNGEIKTVDNKKTQPKAKVEDKITSVTETEEVEKVEKVEATIDDTVSEINEVEEKTTPKKRGRKKKD